jgi:hypothetical protein
MVSFVSFWITTSTGNIPYWYGSSFPNAVLTFSPDANGSAAMVISPLVCLFG